MPYARPRARRRRPQTDEAGRHGAPGPSPSGSEDARRIPAYARGMGNAPGVPLRDGESGESEEVKAAAARAASAEAAPEVGAGPDEGERRVERKPEEATPQDAEAGEERGPVPAVANVEGTGPEEQIEVEARGRRQTGGVRLRGLTRARFSNSFRTLDITAEPGEGCRGCRGRGCVHVTGTLESTFNVATTVTQPRVPRGLSECQRVRVQEAIDDTLAPHEQEHVDAFNTYSGTVETPIDMNVCRGAVNARIAAMHRSLEAARRAAARAASEALDPFSFDVDLDCDEETAAAEPEHTTAGAGSPEEMA